MVGRRVPSCKAIPHAKFGLWNPQWRLSAAVFLLRTARTGPPRAGRGPDGPQRAQNKPKTGPVTPGSGGSPDRVQRGYPRSPPDNCRLPTDNRQPPSTANRQEPLTDNHQPPPTADRHQLPTNNQAGCVKKRSEMEISKVVPDAWGGSHGPFWDILGLF